MPTYPRDQLRPLDRLAEPVGSPSSVVPTPIGRGVGRGGVASYASWASDRLSSDHTWEDQATSGSS